MKKIIFLLPVFLFIFVIFDSPESKGSGTYTPTQSKIRFRISQTLENDYNEVPSIFGVSKVFRHKQDPKTVLSYQVDEEYYQLDPQSVKPQDYVVAFKEVRKDLLSVNGAKNLKITSFKLDRKKDVFYKYKISGEYDRYNGEKVIFHEVNYFKGNVSINIQVVTMAQGNTTITKDEAFSIFDEVLEELDGF